jgi:hypothetical protein
MKRHRILVASLLAPATVSALSGAVRLHITPTVVLQKQADVIRATIPGATQFFVRTVNVGRSDFERIREEGDFEPEEGDFKFYYGQDTGGNVVGVAFFSQVNNQHGPVEVGIAMNPDGSVRDAVVTKATVETKPWVLTALKSGLTRRFRGMHAGDDARAALDGLSRSELGEMPYYMASVVTRAVEQGLVLYDVLYTP